MGRLFGRKRRYSDDEYENEEFDDEIYEDDDDEDMDDDDIDEDESDSGMDDDESDDDDMDDDDVEEDPDDNELDEDPDDEETDDDEEDDEDWEEDERRVYRRRRRIRNQIIAYAVVCVFLLLLIAGGVYAGRKVSGIVKAKKTEQEQERLKAEQEAEAAHDVVIDPPETIDEEETEEPEEDYLGEIVDAYISEMPLADKVAGLFIVKPESITGVSTVTRAGDSTREALNEYAVGGLVYSRKNILDKEQLTEMLSNTVSMSKYPIFLGVEEEGGDASQVAASSIEVIRVGDMAAVGETGDASQAYETGMTLGSYLKELGFNLDFAPVADVADAGSKLGERVFGSDAQAVGDMVSNVVEGIEGVGVSSCLKHFPGIGEAEGDTHAGRVETSRTLDEMRNSEFLPFKAGIEAGADFVMVGHITASAVDEEAVPSSLSKVIMTDVLRDELGFQGVIITDVLDVGAITEYYTSEQAAVMAIEAGADMLFMPEDFNAAYDALLAAVQEGTISEDRINESLERIYRVKCAEKLSSDDGFQADELDSSDPSEEKDESDEPSQP